MNQQKPKSQSDNRNEAEAKEPPPYCGIVMPISPMTGYEPNHWERVKKLLEEAIDSAGYRPRLVSDSDEVGIIHASIVQNLYDDDIVVCDVSGKNPNVMFELGLRLAFDKPTIVVKDDNTDYSFDTGVIKHIGYRSDLRYDDVREFQANVSEAIKATVERKKRDAGYSPFLGHFQRVQVVGLGTQELDKTDYMMQVLSGLNSQMGILTNAVASMQRTISSSTNAAVLRKSPNKSSSRDPNESVTDFMSNIQTMLERLSVAVNKPANSG